MDFYEVLDQVLAILQSRERVTYRALKRQFNLDDDFLDCTFRTPVEPVGSISIIF